MTGGRVRVGRVYDTPREDDGRRVLVDRLWPRGLSKERAHLDAWLKDVSPSAELRTWYGHDPERFDAFAERYGRELTDPDHADAFAELTRWAAEGPLTLLTASRRADISEAAVLRTLLTGGATGGS